MRRMLFHTRTPNERLPTSWPNKRKRERFLQPCRMHRRIAQGRQVQACVHERRRFPGSGEQRPGAQYMDMKIGVFHCSVDLESLFPPTCSIKFLCSPPFAQPSFCIPFCSSMLARLQRSGAQLAISDFCFRLLPCSGSGFKNIHVQKAP